MRAFVLLIAAVLFAPLPQGVSASPQAPTGDALASPKLRIDWAEFRTLYDRMRAVIIDVRDPMSFASGHIPGARSIPLDQIERQAAELKKLRKPIVLYCA
jgi:3-mercaptopyruvate sulfurtransferase SseA